jgi:hypothetical protein
MIRFKYGNKININVKKLYNQTQNKLNVGADFYKMGGQKTIQWGGENVYIGADEKI